MKTLLMKHKTKIIVAAAICVALVGAWILDSPSANIVGFDAMPVAAAGEGSSPINIETYPLSIQRDGLSDELSPVASSVTLTLETDEGDLQAALEETSESDPSEEDSYLPEDEVEGSQSEDPAESAQDSADSEEPAAEEPATSEEPAAEEPPAPQEPAVEEPAAPQEPAAEEPAAPQEPAAEEPVAPKEPATPQEPVEEEPAEEPQEDPVYPQIFPEEYAEIRQMEYTGQAENTEDGSFTVTLTVTVNTLLNNMHMLDRNKHELVPADGVIFRSHEVRAYEGDSVFDVLQREMRNNGIHMVSRFTPIFNSAYIEAINNIFEFDGGPLSGWMYRVNGWFPNFGASQYILSPGDVIDWKYSLDLGRDLGVEWMGGQFGGRE